MGDDERMLYGSLLALLSLIPLGQVSPQDLELRAVLRESDPLCMAIAEDERHAYLVEGSGLSVLKLAQDGKSAELIDRLPLDMGVISMCCNGSKLWIAGGTQGLGLIDFAAKEPRLKIIDAPAKLLCTDVDMLGDDPVATFAAMDASLLRQYESSTYAIVNSIPLPKGRALAVATRRQKAYVAMGTGGLVCVSLNPRAEGVAQGPDLSTLSVPSGFRLQPGFVNDIAVGKYRIFLAADGHGLISVEPKPDFSQSTFELHALGKGSAPTYAHKVAVRNGVVVVGSIRGPGIGAMGAPYTSFGGLGLDLEVGNTSIADFPRGKKDTLCLFRDRPSGVSFERRVNLPTSAYRSLAVSEQRIYAMHHLLGFQVRSLQKPGRVLFQRQPHGLPAIDGRTSLLDPDLLFFGADSEGAQLDGLPRFDGESAFDWPAAYSGEGALGLQFDAQWLDSSGDGEWFMAGSGQGWRLFHHTGKGEEPLKSWKLSSPRDPAGKVGHTYFHSQKHGDLLLLSRVGSRWGLVGYSAKALCAIARKSPVGKVLAALPLWQALTHGAAVEGDPYAWRCALLPTAGEGTLAVLAAGYEWQDGDSKQRARQPRIRRSRSLVFALQGSAEPQRLAVLHGNSLASHAITVDAARIGERNYAFVGELDGRLTAFDITDTSACQLVGEWIAPRSPFDGLPECFLEVAVYQDGAQSQLFVAAGRLGLLQFDVSDPTHLAPRAIIDTPGWATGLHVQRTSAATRVWLGDQKGGLRLYELVRQE